MTLYKLDGDALDKVTTTTFSAESIEERRHLQQILKKDISILSNDLLVIAEEFNSWDTGRRIDLLCLNSDRCLVVVELKRTEDGGHMDLQAIRYAAMVSPLTYEQAVEEHSKLLGCDADYSRVEINRFLDCDFEDNVELSGDVKIILASANFSKEITTTVLWLNRMGLSIECFRLIPYSLSGTVLIDFQKIIPLPEAEDYLTKINAKEAREKTYEAKQLRDGKQRYIEFWTAFLESDWGKSDIFPTGNTRYQRYLSTRAFKGLRGVGLAVMVSSRAVRCYIYLDSADRDLNKAIFDELSKSKDEISRVVGHTLIWKRMDENRASQVYAEREGFGLGSGPEGQDEAFSWLSKTCSLMADAFGKKFYTNPLKALIKK